jgi:2-aminoethylphosphonate-pyruvate transaminase
MAQLDVDDRPIDDLLLQLLRAPAESAVALVPGGGDAALESAIAAAVPRGKKLLVADNGAAGERLLAIARALDIAVIHIRYPWGDRVVAADVADALVRDPEIAAVAVAHLDPSVGLLSPVAELAAICRGHGALLVLDVTASLGCEELAIGRDGIDLAVGSSDGLGAPAGLGLVCLSPRLRARLESRNGAARPRSYALDLRRHLVRGGGPAVDDPLRAAVAAACAALLAIPSGPRLAAGRRRALRLRDGLARFGFVPLTRTGQEAQSIVICGLREGVSLAALAEALGPLGGAIAPCSDVLAGTFVQVAIGALSDADVEPFLEAVRSLADRSGRHGLRLSA